MKPLRDLLKHSSVYAVGQILTRLASVLLLPLYTHCLTPADYGVTAILDLTAAILSLMIGGGMVSAVARFHFDSDSPAHRDRLWWTGLTYLATTSCVVLLPLWMGRQVLSDLTLGENYPDGGHLYTLTIATILVQNVAQLVEAYLRVLKWSGVFVAISFGRLLLNVGLNLWLLVGMDMGVEGLLLGNFAASLIHTVALLVVFVKTRGKFQFDFSLSLEMLRFSAPLVVTAMLAMLMHEADRYFLRVFISMEEVGVYSLAHKIGFAVNTLCLLPFSSIWHVAIYDIDRMPKANDVYAKVFSWFIGGMGILLLGAALTVHPILPLLTPDAYGDAIDLISLILLGFFLFGLQLQFEVPAMLAKKTGAWQRHGRCRQCCGQLSVGPNVWQLGGRVGWCSDLCVVFVYDSADVPLNPPDSLSMEEQCADRCRSLLQLCGIKIRTVSVSWIVDGVAGIDWMLCGVGCCVVRSRWHGMVDDSTDSCAVLSETCD